MTKHIIIKTDTLYIVLSVIVALIITIVTSLLPDDKNTPEPLKLNITACEIISNNQVHIMPCHAITESLAKADIWLTTTTKNTTYAMIKIAFGCMLLCS